MHRNSNSERNLWYVNFVTCVVHLTCASVVIGLWTDWPIPVTTSFIDWHVTNSTLKNCDDGNCYVKKSFATWPDIPDISLMGLVLGFHFLSISWQFLVLLPTSIQDMYHAYLTEERNPFRWCEYALSAPLMMIVISAMLGEVDISVYVLLAVCTSVLMGLGHLQETHMRTTLVPHQIGWALFFLTWSVPTFTFYVSLTQSQSVPPARIVTIVWATYLLMIVLFGCFGIVQTVHVNYNHNTFLNKIARNLNCCRGKQLAYKFVKDHNGPPPNYYYKIELAYGVLSATAKVALAILVMTLIRVRQDMLQLEFVGSADDSFESKKCV